MNKTKNVVRRAFPPDNRRIDTETDALQEILKFSFDDETSSRILQVTQRNTEACYVLFVSVIQLLLWQYHGMEDVLLGVYRGDSPSILQACVEMQPEQRFKDYLYAVRDVMRMPKRMPPDVEESIGVCVAFDDLHAANSQIPLDAWMIRLRVEENRFEAAVQYPGDLYFQNTIWLICHQIQALLIQCLQHPDSPIWELSAQTEWQKNRILSWNRTTVSYDARGGLLSRFLSQVGRNPQNRAVIDCDGTMSSYEEMDHRSTIVARHLLRCGCRSGDVVAVAMDRQSDLIAVLLGILKAGAVYLPLDKQNPLQRLQYILCDTDARILVTDVPGIFKSIQEELFVIDTDALKENSNCPELPVITTKESDAAYIIYTSGSTGTPKGVIVDHGAIVNRLNWMMHKYQFDTSDCLLQKTNIAFDVSIWELYLWFFAGASVYMLPPGDEKDAQRIGDAICKHGVTTVHFVPTMFSSFLSYCQQAHVPLPSLRRVFTSGEALETIHVERFFSLFKNKEVGLYNLYGPTEATVDVSYYDCSPQFFSTDVPIGGPIENIRLYILDEHYRLAPIGMPGTLYIAGDGLARGYLNRPELTAKQFMTVCSERVYNTNDRARQTLDGHIHFLGRKDFQVKLNGFRIELDEIQHVLNRSAFVEQSVVIKYEDASPDSARLVAYYVPKKENDLPELTDSQADSSRVSEWRLVFNKTYSSHESEDTQDQLFNISGWKSSYTGEAFSREEMSDWLDNGIRHVRRLPNRHVLEIGCGTGLVLYRLAPSTDSYRASDISETAVAMLNDTISQDQNLQHVKVDVQAADNPLLYQSLYDMVILNSVIQYFPNHAYLEKVLRLIGDTIAENGHALIGDIRSEPLLKAFHTSVELSRMPGDTSAPLLKAAVDRGIFMDYELCVNPAFFMNLRDVHPRMAGVEILYKQSRYDNEMRRYRYDVVIYFDHIPDSWPCDKKLVWGQQSPAELEKMVSSQMYNSIRLSHVPNTDVSPELYQYQQLLYDSDEKRIVCDIHAAAARMRQQEAWSKEQWRKMAEHYGYHMECLWSGPDMDSYYDLVFIRSCEIPNLSHYICRQAKREIVSDFSDYFNLRYGQADEMWKTNAAIREYLAAYLPSYMIPSILIPLDAMPAKPNGKIDYAALPQPYILQNTAEMESPKTQWQRQLLEVWQTVLRLQAIGINDDFFMCGGDSIKAISLVNRINQSLHINMHVNDIYMYSTIKKLSQVIDKRLKETSDDTLRKGMEILQNLKERVLSDRYLVSLLPVDWEDLYPVSPIQMGMFLYTRMYPDVPMYLDQFIYQVKLDSFSYVFFCQCMETMVQKHAIMRTTFDFTRFPQPLQIVRQGLSLSRLISMEDLRALPDPQTQIRAYLEDDLSNHFELEKDFLWRIKIFWLGEGAYCIVLSFHHAILDGWSVATFMSELVKLYEIGVKRNFHWEPEPAASTFRDYIAYTMGRTQSDQDMAYWHEVLDGFHYNALPYNPEKTPLSQMRRTHIVIRDLPNFYQHKLQSYAYKNKVSLKELCIAAYVFLLRITSYEHDVLTGIVSHDRPELADAEKIVGCFLNTVPLRVQINGNNKKDLLYAVRDYLRRSKQHEMFLSDIAKTVQEVGRHVNPLFETIFNYVDFHVLDSIRLAESVQEIVSPLSLEPNEMTNTPFDFEVSRTMDKFSVRIKYDSRYFHKSEMQECLDMYLEILDQMMDEHHAEFSCESLKGRARIQADYNSLNNTSSDFPLGGLHTLFERWAAGNPERIAASDAQHRISYGELNAWANRLARKLVKHGIRPGDIVAIQMQRCIPLIAALLAILKAGAAYVPLDRKYPLERRAYMIRHAGAVCLLTDKVTGDMTVPVVDMEGLENYESGNLDIPVSENQLAYIIYTSGSTGRPKGVMIEHRSAVNIVHWVNEKFAVGPGDKLLFVTSVCFDLSVYDIFGTLAAGAQVVMAQEEDVLDIGQLFKIMQREKITIWNSVPSTMQGLVHKVKGYGEHSDSLRLALLSGDWIPVDLPSKAETIFPHAKFISLGGATEAAIWSIYYEIDPQQVYSPSIPYGRPVANSSFYVLNDNRELLAPGYVGELYIGGAGVARGYVNDPQKNMAFMVDPFVNRDAKMYRTGDLGRLKRDGTIEFLGRKDSQVKIRGFRVELGEIESILCRFPTVKDCVVALQSSPQGDQVLSAYLVTDSPIDKKRIQDHLANYLPSYMIPVFYMAIDSIPLNVNGKVDRSQLKPVAAAAEKMPSSSRPLTRTQDKIHDIWKQTLGVDAVDITDSFFEIGGNSLSLLQVQTMLEELYGDKCVTITDLFTYHTIEALSKYLDEWLLKENADKVSTSMTLVQEYRMSATDKPQETDLEYVFQLDDKTQQGLENFASGLESLYSMQIILMGNFIQLMYEICKETHVTLLDGNDLSSCYRWDMAQIQTYEDLFDAFQNRSSYRIAAMNLQVDEAVSRQDGCLVSCFVLAENSCEDSQLQGNFELVVGCGGELRFLFDHRIFCPHNAERIVQDYFKLLSNCL
ncbi:non-ribosomal peptide synthetase [Bianquea renquensis]|uniref:Amino acid adenylation domain-containing protein n=1 Tax=Bianquea renquensis TaxID=2763661 RepID=A0A926DVS9_9FIRM|nr:non-ribosomal peptide synthetase [Bianquea renquensis]MBC8544813.1 amino acid adenylation domain-containing protein [Bianquea renquensis]